MNLRQKLYQMFILGTSGEGYEKALQDGLGGIIFFTPDIQLAEQFKELTQKCKDLAIIPPFLSIDQEGGRVERTENIHNGKQYLSAKYAYEKGLEFLKEQTKNIADELCSYGINLNFAPCIDVNTNPNNPIIGERAFSNKVEEVIEAEKIVSSTYRQNGIIPCVKHYPGHGDANADSHLTLPEINLSLEEMEKTHIKPFASCAKEIEMVMVAHLHCTCFEKDVIPTSLSKNAINYLRNELGFEGITISDDMVMKGVAKFGAVEAVEMGIRAGLNMFIYRNSDAETIEMIETVATHAENDKELAENINKSFEKIIELKNTF
ncbi:MAG: glycoside hydrolase family 3 protein [Cyanobacteria bacterium SIG32]|nr:glycoside hydrolase family 3 protein [Cyanobacteria bacterium SIG32]